MPITRKTRQEIKQIIEEDQEGGPSNTGFGCMNLVEYGLIAISFAVVVIAAYTIFSSIKRGDVSPQTPSIALIKSAVEDKGFLNVTVGKNDPVQAKESCAEGEYYFPISAKDTLGKDVNLYVCTLDGSHFVINFR